MLPAATEDAHVLHRALLESRTNRFDVLEAVEEWEHDGAAERLGSDPVESRVEVVAP